MNKFSILLVDDIEANLHSLKILIEDSFDINIFTAIDAKSAIKILLENEIHLILSDIQMPQVDGFQFAQYIKTLDETKNIPIIFITGIYDKDEYKKRGYNLGAIEYISKPIDDVLLNAKLKVYIDLYDSKRKSDNELKTKDEVLIHQSKLATLGEMIGVISHQMKQPLNILSLYCCEVKNSYDLKSIDDEFIKDFESNTSNQIKFMSQTIDDFTNFFNPNKIKNEFLLSSVLDKTLSLLNKQMQNHDIEINVNISDEKIYGVNSELQQVFLNLITNSKDAFIERNIVNREININAFSKEQYTIIMYEDNAGGVKDNIDKLFDPYFTTKEKGTGTGLYMVKMVIKSSFNGELKVQNLKNGLKFILALPNKLLVQ